MIFGEYCQDNQVWAWNQSIPHFCDYDTGLCDLVIGQPNEWLEEDCSLYQTDLICKDDNVVESGITGVCVEVDDTASCETTPVEEIIEYCGPDSCTEFTELNIYVPEHVTEEESCEEVGVQTGQCPVSTEYHYQKQGSALSQRKIITKKQGTALSQRKIITEKGQGVCL